VRARPCEQVPLALATGRMCSRLAQILAFTKSTGVNRWTRRSPRRLIEFRTPVIRRALSL
jgi:hypothetical protein